MAAWRYWMSNRGRLLRGRTKGQDLCCPRNIWTLLQLQSRIHVRLYCKEIFEAGSTKNKPTGNYHFTLVKVNGFVRSKFFMRATSTTIRLANWLKSMETMGLFAWIITTSECDFRVSFWENFTRKTKIPTKRTKSGQRPTCKWINEWCNN